MRCAPLAVIRRDTGSALSGVWNGIVLVQDNLNTHKPASLYEAFPPAEARRLVERFEWHYTPKHGSWLDMVESELGVLSFQCLDRQIPDQQMLKEEVDAWEAPHYERLGRLGGLAEVVEIPFNELKITMRDGKDWLTLNRTKDELKSAPAYDKKAENRM